MQSLPSPADSPSLKSKELNSQPSSRKRLRSQSMQSDASSSSAKRSLSEDPHVDDLSVEAITDIDTYMAEQGEADIPTTIQLPTHILNGSAPTLSPPEKFSAVKTLREQPMKVGDTWYIVARQWYRRWEKACTGETDKEGSVDENLLGPVDNSILLDKDGNVTSNLVEGVDVEFVCEELWALFVTWYGEPAHPLPRKVIPRGVAKELGLELRPPRFKVLLLQKSESTLISGPPHSYVTVSIADTVANLCMKLATTVNPDVNIPSRIWSIEGTDFSGSLYPSSRLFLDAPKILTPSDETLEDAMIESDDPFVVEFQENGSFILDVDGISGKSLPPSVPPPLFSSDTDFFTQKFPPSSSSSSTSTKFASSSTLNGKTIPGLFKGNTYGSSMNTRNQTVHEPGTLGLGNMGNTCFMNSALQCLAHCKELTDYFLTGVYQEELNPDNPLGMHGAIAEAFGALLNRIWAPNSTSYSYSPREFKQQLQRFAPQFSGYQQHDSQELVAFLLDGLHEDLNRVLKKPYVVKPDWEGGGDKELVELAQKSWEGYMMRNDSVIVDLFQGQYQSTLVCPECQKVSITFDPFMYLTLPLPVQKKWRHEVYYVPWDIEKKHVKVPVEINRDASFKDLRHLLGRWMGAQPDNLLTLEIFSNKFYKSLDDSLLCGEMNDTDVIICFELPCHAQQSRTYKKQPDDPFIVPVYLSDHVQPRYTYRAGPSLFGYPFIVVIDHKQATDLDSIYDAVVAQLERWTENARDLYSWEAGDHSDNAPIQITNGANFPMDAPTAEIKENGDVIIIDDVLPEEGDIVDEKSMVVLDAETDMSVDTIDIIPRKIGTKKNLFQLRLQINHKEYGTVNGYGASAQRYERWADRQNDADMHPVLLRQGDAFFCEFDENMKAYYFGDEPKHVRWVPWEQFIHPDYTEAKKASAEKRNKGMSLDDCLTEFTKEEQLGEDDLWYCPQCKKHQQATKKFDLWKAPDVLVVHLKRFSNSRILRDKIDTMVDFPIEGLDISDMVGERQVAKKLLATGIDVEEMGLNNLEEPLVYDLFGVDEHLGGLGGGHYRAYASNHITNQWYHFDDSYVTKARATDAVNANAYLLFYKRRTNKPLGGKTHDKIQEARSKESSASTSSPDHITIATQLPTPPDEPIHSSYLDSGSSRLTALLTNLPNDGCPTPRSNAISSAGSSPPPLEDKELPSFEDSRFDTIIHPTLDPLQLASQSFDFPELSSQASPTSSTEAEPDLEHLDYSSDWDSPELFGNSQSHSTAISGWAPVTSPDSSSSELEGNPFADANKQKGSSDIDTEISTPHSQTVDTDI